MMMSGALLRLAFNNPPTASPRVLESASVADPMSWASGMIDRAEAAKTRIGLAPNHFRPIAIGTKASSQFKLMSGRPYRKSRAECGGDSMETADNSQGSGGIDPRGSTCRLCSGRQLVGQSSLHPLDEDPCPAVVRHERPSPLNHDEQAVAETDQEHDVDEQPGQPGEEPGGLEPADVGDRPGAADRGQHSLVRVAERLGKLAAKSPQNIRGGMSSLLHRGRCDARHKGAVLLEVSQIPDDVDVIAAGDGQVRLHDDSTGIIQRNAKGARQW